jgi:hypothetical protein
MWRCLLLTVSVALPAVALAQDTPTERLAAADVLAKMAALERSLDVPALVTKLTAPDDARDRVVTRSKELMDKELLALADDIATHPEIGFEEKPACPPRSSPGTSGTTAARILASSSSTTRCVAPKGPFTATSTARRVPSASRRQSPLPST